MAHGDRAVGEEGKRRRRRFNGGEVTGAEREPCYRCRVSTTSGGTRRQARGEFVLGLTDDDTALEELGNDKGQRRDQIFIGEGSPVTK